MERQLFCYLWKECFWLPKVLHLQSTPVDLRTVVADVGNDVAMYLVPRVSSGALCSLPVEAMWVVEVRLRNFIGWCDITLMETVDVDENELVRLFRWNFGPGLMMNFQKSLV